MLRILGVVLLGLGIISVVGYLTFFKADEFTINNVPSAVATSTDVAELSAEELLEEATQKMIEDAITASSSVIEAAKQEASVRIENEMKLKIEREVRANLHEQNATRIEEIDKETKVY